MKRTLWVLLTAALAGVITAGISLLTDDIALAVATGVSWGCGLGITAYIGQAYPTYATGGSWVDTRWTALGTGITGLCLSLVLSLSEVTPWVAVLLGGIAILSYASGTIATLEQQQSRDKTQTSGTIQSADS
jgi:hypothetical protein